MRRSLGDESGRGEASEKDSARLSRLFVPGSPTPTDLTLCAADGGFLTAVLHATRLPPRASLLHLAQLALALISRPRSRLPLAYILGQYEPAHCQLYAFVHRR